MRLVLERFETIIPVIMKSEYALVLGTFHINIPINVSRAHAFMNIVSGVVNKPDSSMFICLLVCLF